MLNTTPRRKLLSLLGSLGLWGALITLDLATGLKMRFGPAYALPVMLFAWHLGRTWGLVAGLVSASLWHGIQMFILHEHTLTFFRYWDLTLGLGAFLGIAVLTTWWKNLFLTREALNRDLQSALDRVQVLEGMLSICAWCRKVRNHEGTWEPLEEYVTEHSGTTWTHGVCPECEAKLKEHGLA